ncbi:MAG: NAD(P)H-hydrate dehydratase [Chloroflexota bacterium]
MKIFSCDQIREIDSYTIIHEPIASIDLMERAAGRLFGWISEEFSHSDHFMIFTGPGNNGGDGLALARMLGKNGYQAEVFHVSFTEKTSKDWEINRKRLEDVPSVKFSVINNAGQIPLISSDDIVVDSIFGSGLNRPADGLAREIIQLINQTDAVRVSVDMPSGLFCEDNGCNDPEAIIHADFTLCFQFPKLAFLFPENMQFAGIWKILPIGLHEKAIATGVTPYHLLSNEDLALILKIRTKFDHKGNFGHGLLVAGSYGKMGAAVLGASAALRAGIGLITCQIPSCGYEIIQSSLPEAMVKTDAAEEFITSVGDTGNYSAIGIGPGIGTAKETQSALRNLLAGLNKPLVLDADALNILSMNKEWLELIPRGTILTPHPKEFSRIAGETADSYQRLQRQKEFSQKYGCIIVLKGAHTSITFPDGNVYFNSTGNPGMATAGSGDVLTGILVSLLSQGYSPENAAVLGVYLHGLAGDIAAEGLSFEAIIASDIINCIGKAFNRIRGF